MKYQGHKIMAVTPGSIAEELELEPGDVLLTIDGEELEDIFDYDYMTDAESFVMVVRKANGEEWELEIESGGEDLGLTFENGLMSDYKSCSNKCIFCFIDQMPPGMRETLYFKDDDSRLSFLQGNYITLTNMKDKDIERIIRFHLAPINISVQTMNPELRCKMLHNRFAGEALKKIDRLYEAGTEMNGQIVLCRGVNDGKELAYTIEQLSKYAPVMQSVSVVPVGLSKYREGLYPLEPFTKEDACEVIDLIENGRRSTTSVMGSTLSMQVMSGISWRSARCRRKEDTTDISSWRTASACCGCCMRKSWTPWMRRRTTEKRKNSLSPQDVCRIRIWTSL